jgi:hypothetical protein
MAEISMGLRANLAVIAVFAAQLGCSGGGDKDHGTNTNPIGGDGDVAGDGDVNHGDGDHPIGDGDTNAGDGDSHPIGDGDTNTGDGDTSTGDGDSAQPCGGSCPDGTTCNPTTNTCDPQTPVCDCQKGSYCDTTSNTCVPGCLADTDCPDGDVCDKPNKMCVVQPTCEQGPAPNLTITGVFGNQAVEIPLIDRGKEVAVGQRPARLVQGRDLVFRVMVTPGASFSPSDIVAEVTLDNGGTKTKFSAGEMVTQASDESKLDGTINVRAAAASIGPNTKYTVALTTKGCANVDSAPRFASVGPFDLKAEKTGRVKVTIVPYERAPYKLDTSDATLQAIKDGLWSFYPTEGFDLTIHAPVPVMNPSTDLSRILQHVGQLRAQDNPAEDVYYFALFVAATKFRDFCGNGCVAGISTLGGDSEFGDASERYGTGIGYFTDTATTSMGKPTTDKIISIQTMAHELGHAHGRQHAPCGGPAGIDPGFPNKDASIDTYGINLSTGAFATDATHTDIMAYCEPNWITAYTYDALATRIQGLNGNNHFEVKGAPKEYASVVIHDTGRATWGEHITLRGTVSGEVRTARAYDLTGRLVANVKVNVSRLGEQGVLVRLPVPDLTWDSIELDGKRIAIEHTPAEL